MAPECTAICRATYRGRVDEWRCGNRTNDASGLCRWHRKGPPNPMGPAAQRDTIAALRAENALLRQILDRTFDYANALERGLAQRAASRRHVAYIPANPGLADRVRVLLAQPPGAAGQALIAAADEMEDALRRLCRPYPESIPTFREIEDAAGAWKQARALPDEQCGEGERDE